MKQNNRNDVAAVQRARKLLDIYQGEVDDFFKLWPPDKQYFFSSDNKSFLAYGAHKGIAICMGEPVGYRQSIQVLLEEFMDHCSDNHLRPAFIQTTDKYSQEFKAAGLKNILIGSDAVIDLDQFMSTTIHNKYFRNIVNRFTKQDFSINTYSPPHSQNVMDELLAISTSWLQIPGKKEWSFLTGKFNEEYFQQVTLYVLRDKQGNAVAFTNELPSFKQGVCTIDLMRHRSDSPPNSIDYLFISLLKTKQKEGYIGFNLGMSPIDAKPFAKNLSAKILISLYRVSNNFIGFKGLHQFKSKYEPNWEPRFVWYKGSLIHLPKIGIAVSKLMKNG